MPQIVLHISAKAYKTLTKAVKEMDETSTLEQVLEQELNNPEPFIEILGWDNY